MSQQPISTQRQTSLSLVEAFNQMDIDSIISFRTPDCTRHILPSSLNIASQNNIQYRTHLEQLKPIFRNFKLHLQDLMEDRDAGKVMMHLTARAETLVGEYVNEYFWVLEFDGSGEKVRKSTEFVDAVVNREFWPKLREAIRERREQQMSR